MSENVKIENKKTEGKDLTAEIKNLVVEFRTDYGVVQALNGLDLEIGRGKTLGWEDRREPVRRRRACPCYG